VKACEFCGTTKWDIYGLANQNYPAWFKHWCPRQGREIFANPSDESDHRRLSDSASQSRANADAMRAERAK